MSHVRIQSILFGVILGGFVCSQAQSAEVKILNVSYDVTREFYQEINPIFSAQWHAKTGDTLTVNQSHGGSSKQARSVIDGLEADVVTMNNVPDVDILQTRGALIPKDWASRLPNKSTPYTSTILFIVRSGNPKAIKDWSDLIRPGVGVILPNPKTSGNGRYSYLAAYGYALKSLGGDQAKARDFVAKLFANVPVLDAGGRGATTTFAQRGLGDVLLTFENEVQLTLREFGRDKFEVVTPSVSIVAENPVVWVDKVVAKRGTADVSKAYLEFLFTPQAQEIAAKHGFRPTDPAVLKRHSDQFKSIELFSVEGFLGGWSAAQKTHFVDGGVFDQIYTKK